MTAISLVVAGILFVAYPALRPFSSETGLEGAQAFASTNWIIAHSLAMAGFILLGLGAARRLRDDCAERRRRAFGRLGDGAQLGWASV